MSNTKHTATPWMRDQYGAVKVGRDTVLVTGFALNTGRSSAEAEANTDFIVTACNAYDQLAADNANLRQDLSDARTGWEQATEAVREADEVLAKERALREQLVQSCKNLAQIVYTQNGNLHDDINRVLDIARAALAAAEAA